MLELDMMEGAERGLGYLWNYKQTSLDLDYGVTGSPLRM